MRLRRAMLSAVLCSVAPSAPALAQAAPSVPEGFFSTVFSSYQLTAASYSSPFGASFVGQAVFGQRAGTTGPLGYALWMGVQAYDVTPSYLELYSLFASYRVGSASGGGFLTFRDYDRDRSPTTPWLTAVAYGGGMPEFYAGGAAPSEFRLARAGAELTWPRPAGVGSVEFAVSTVPEPSTFALGAVGLIVGGAFLRRRQVAGASPFPDQRA
jgi:hypothetical protein